jgi:hypothetical protein
MEQIPSEANSALNQSTHSPDLKKTESNFRDHKRPPQVLSQMDPMYTPNPIFILFILI